MKLSRSKGGCISFERFFPPGWVLIRKREFQSATVRVRRLSHEINVPWLRDIKSSFLRCIDGASSGDARSQMNLP